MTTQAMVREATGAVTRVMVIANRGSDVFDPLAPCQVMTGPHRVDLAGAGRSRPGAG